MKYLRAAACASLLAIPLLAGSPDTIATWTAPPYWTPPSPREAEDRAFGRELLGSEPLSVEALPSSPMPFVAITPCRLADTRGNGFSGSYGPPALTAGSPRSFTITGQCGIPTGALAVSFNVTVTNTLGAGFILAYPSDGTAPTVSTLNYVSGQTVANAAVVPLSTGGAASFIAGVSGTDLILDVNGYYAPAGIVNSVNGLSGTLTLAQGTNVTITPSGSTLTIASSPGTHTHAATDIVSGTLPGGRLSGTYGNALELSNPANIYTGASATLSGDLNLAATSRITLGSIPFLYTAGSTNTFGGVSAGNAGATGKDSSAWGAGALAALAAGSGNTAMGSGTLAAVTSGSENTAVGVSALGMSVSDGGTAVGAGALASNLFGVNNSALGWHALTTNVGSDNTAVGSSAMAGNTGGDQNTAVGSGAIATLNGTGNAAFGYRALGAATGGDNNTAVGTNALSSLATGSSNIAIGKDAGSTHTSGGTNIYIGNVGAATESATIRIGSTQTAAYMAGVSGATSSSGVAVLVNSSGKLGTTTSSRRYKRDVEDVGAASDVLLRLRPVAFRYTEERDPSGERQYGLIAEEVADVAPELVVFGKDGQPETVKYHLVNALLLELAKRQQGRIERLESENADLRARLERIERALGLGR